MTVPETFLSRWARLKRTAETPPSGIEPGETTIARPDPAAVEDPAFDPASLPSIEAIDLNTDIRGFLQRRVPAELTRAALRQAWVSDPAIRDFIGIAENQWDFNDPEGMFGFEPLPEGYDVSGLLSQALGGRDRLAEATPQPLAQIGEPTRTASDRQPTDLSLDGRHSPEGGPRSLPEDRNEEAVAPENDQLVEANDRRPNRRRHGSALPRLDG